MKVVPPAAGGARARRTRGRETFGSTKHAIVDGHRTADSETGSSIAPNAISREMDSGPCGPPTVRGRGPIELQEGSYSSQVAWPVGDPHRALRAEAGGLAGDFRSDSTKGTFAPSAVNGKEGFRAADTPLPYSGPGKGRLPRLPPHKPVGCQASRHTMESSDMQLSPSSHTLRCQHENRTPF